MKAAPEIASDVRAYGLHPALLDACLHLIGAALPEAGMKLREPFLLLNVDSIAVHDRLPDEFWTHIVLDVAAVKDLEKIETFRADLTLLDDAGRVIAELRGERLELLAVVRGLEALPQPSRVTLVTPNVSMIGVSADASSTPGASSPAASPLLSGSKWALPHATSANRTTHRFCTTVANHDRERLA